MDFSSSWNYAPFVAAIAVMLVVVVLAALFVRSHRSQSGPAPLPQAPLTEIDPDLIDSSHIGFAPLVGSVSLPSRESGKNGA